MSGMYGAVGKPGSVKARLGFFEHITTLPVVTGIDGVVKSAVLRRDNYDTIVDLFRAGDLEGGLLPIDQVLAAANCVIIPGSACSTMGASRLFFLVSKKLPTEIRRVLVDRDEMGGTTLGKLVLAKKLMIRPEFIRSEQHLDPSRYDLAQDDGYDAYLLVGRHGFMVRKEAFAFSLDLTMAYYELCRQPYVINAWVVRKGLNLGPLDKEIGDAARRNDGNRDLVPRAAEKLGVAESAVRAVYEKALNTRFDPQVIASIRNYARLLTQERLLPVHTVMIYTPPAAARPTGKA